MTLHQRVQVGISNRDQAALNQPTEQFRHFGMVAGKLIIRWWPLGEIALEIGKGVPGWSRGHHELQDTPACEGVVATTGTKVEPQHPPIAEMIDVAFQAVKKVAPRGIVKH